MKVEENTCYLITRKNETDINFPVEVYIRVFHEEDNSDGSLTALGQPIFKAELFSNSMEERAMTHIFVEWFDEKESRANCKKITLEEYKKYSIKRTLTN